jgi:hypothetical protein
MIVEQSVEWELVGQTEVLGKNLPLCLFVHKKIPHDLTWARTRAAAVGSQRLTAWAIDRTAKIHGHPAMMQNAHFRNRIWKSFRLIQLARLEWACLRKTEMRQLEDLPAANQNKLYVVYGSHFVL